MDGEGPSWRDAAKVEISRGRGAIWRRRLLVVGLVAGLASALAGFGLAQGAPSSITTCTKTSTGKIQVIATTEVGKCTKKGKGTATTWDKHSTTVSLMNQLAASQSQFAASQQQTAAAERYHSLMFGTTAWWGVDEQLRRHDASRCLLALVPLRSGPVPCESLRRASTGVGLVNADLSDANMTWVFADDSFLWNSDLSNANLSNVNLYQAELNNANLSNFRT